MIQTLLDKIHSGRHLSPEEAESAMEEILSGRMDEDSIVALLAALRDNIETVEELVGFARAMRRRVTPILLPTLRNDELLVDTCGTGGDALGTFNISTAAAFAVAGAGVRVAKHGNRSISSRCGSADVLEALGVRIDLEMHHIGEAIERIGIGFLFAPAAHTATKHAMPARRRLGGRTVFNLLGPLTNPAGAHAQVAGVFSATVVEKVANALAALGSKHAFVVHGDDGLDEISISGETQIGEVCRGTVHLYTVTPEDFDVSRAALSEIAGGDAHQNAAIIQAIFAGEPGPRRDIVIVNAAAALVAAGRASGFREGARLAATSIDSGAAQEKLESLVAFTK